jgi:hypothetical protein
MSKQLNNQVFLNYIGGIPFSTEELPERVYLVGPGTDRPVGFVFEQMHDLYWNAKGFDIAAGSVNFDDPFTKFLLSGGMSGTLIGAMVGTAVVTSSFLEGVGALFAKTERMVVINRIKKRKFSEKDLNEEGQVLEMGDTELIIEDGKAVITTLHKDEPTVGDICGAGPVFKASKNGSQCIIDFSDIIYYKYQYWPRISLSWFKDAVSSVISYSTKDGKVVRGSAKKEMSGGVLFKGAVIKMYQPINWDVSRAFEIASGTITPLYNEDHLEKK